ncbi:cytidine and deoxycytidylate deaminase zinc-binding region [Sphingobacterium spiritivorum ATCC 33300]|uniref:Cytidine and deoxycytidylate deaminase zinc-binding region n=1 Tax=Sphingobacterium spiritivorum ATCC 33300 TaxID=525372 RepID=C2FZZ7_SPHSI|nr:cytidine and deoxycytidylate deaminase zinc-binding region [Sphingobacterium spiritivorum ATCC 33300]
MTAHAEMQAFTAASSYLGGKYLKDCTLYVTVEPCVMCAGASYWTQVSRIVYGAPDEKRGASRYGKLFHPKTEIISGVLQEECAELITSFFRQKR